MKLNRSLVNTLLIAMVAGLAIALAAEHRLRLRLAVEHLALEERCNGMPELLALNGQLQMSNRLGAAEAPDQLPPDQLMELLRLRSEIGGLQHKLDQARDENRQAHTALEKFRKTMNGTNEQATPDYWPQGAWANAGRASPEAALKSLLWAGYNGDLTNFLAGVAEGDAREALAKQFSGKSDAEAALRLADDTAGVKSIQILESEATDDNTVVLTVELENNDSFQTVRMVMTLAGGDWKFGGPQD